MAVKITSLVDDYCFNTGFLGEHGLSMLLETPGGSLLLDTGSSGLPLEHNAAALDIDLSQVDAVAVTHGHNDHIGGLKTVLQKAKKNMPVYAHPDVFQDRVKKIDSKLVPTGSPFSQEELEEAGATFVFHSQPVEVVPGIMLTGKIERGFDEIKTRSHFIYRDGDLCADPFIDDQAAVVETEKGLCIVFGCAHSGVINTMNYVEKITGEKYFYGLFGGTHLLEAGDGQLKETLAEIERRQVKILGVSHCTGINTSAFFARNFSGKSYQVNSGFCIKL